MYDDIDLELNFSDITISETDGNYKDVNEKMISEFPYSKEWMIKTNLTVESKYGVAYIELHFYNNKDIYVVDFKPSIGNVFYNPDIIGLSQWSQENGWNIPKPNKELTIKDREFWKYFYDTLIIDSDYFDKHYGERPQLKGKNEKK